MRVTRIPIVASPTAQIPPKDFRLNPLEHKEWVDGQLLEKDGITLKDSRIQAKLTQQGKGETTWPP
ncbi:hypothetical protein AVDCRST_MAG81-1541 [uncultured Synechococcales cyanobacterium]|uniref:Uncharacterized protein n=1 Tax=uncultured Synechococcales cyanobacterium TaxID=1936017 RepID=A0A6J4V424_9CYAN|nr:hypothetical protein AVDCRST_MAG81-1541 [uncultured Synechococcales cyanobacterium]